jgi:predicted TIM-barrel fold metal-dependent hydrolase
MPPEVAENTTFFKVQWSDFSLQLKAMDEAGIQKSVLLYPTSDAHLKMGGWNNVCKIYNEEIAKKAKEYPERVIGAGILPVDDEGKIPVELKRIKELGLLAVSLGSSYDGKFLDSERFFAVFEFCQKENLPIFIHSQVINPIGFERVDDPLIKPVVEYVFDITVSMAKLMMSGIFNKYPDLKFVFAHFAGVVPFIKDRFDSTYQMLRQRQIVKDLGALPSEIFKKIYVDTSGVKSVSMLNMALETFSAKNILWGSDFPAKRDLAESIGTINKLDLSQEEKQGILGRNLEEIFSV